MNLVPGVASLDLTRAMAEAARAVEEQLNRLLPPVEGPEGPLLAAMRYACLGGGKRLRPFLVVESSALFGVAREAAWRVAAAIEMLHCYSLVHDDLPCMDDDDLRRGRPTVHRAFGRGPALLAGDALLTLAFEVLAEESTHADPKVRAELTLELAKAAGARGMCGGQMIDLRAAKEPLDTESVARLQRMKTGALIAFAAKSGAILGRASPVARHALLGYGNNLGLAFQIADDLLDLEGDAGEVGKATGKDEAAGKATLVAALGVEGARRQARLLAEQAAQHLDGFEGRGALLRAVAEFVITRRS
ncbi:MAG: polyprenyl synthetase family protein [Alphaproteobacteria bacterium]|nr:polyprenyl synthetase family protein [Alphaproteobacteria bacterium]